MDALKFWFIINSFIFTWIKLNIIYVVYEIYIIIYITPPFSRKLDAELPVPQSAEDLQVLNEIVFIREGKIELKY